MKSRQEIKALAKEAMKQQRGTSILLLLVLSLVTFASVALDMIVLLTLGMGVAYWVVYLVGLAVILVMAVNVLGEYIKVYKYEQAEVGALFSGLKVNFLRKLGGMLWMSLWVMLWSLLLVIPGIIKGLSYYFTANILADCPEVGAREALKLSMRITQGHKMDIFIFILSWIGWMMLSALTLGILYVVYVGPYWATSDAGLYLEMRKKAVAEGRIAPEEFGKTAAELGL